MQRIVVDWGTTNIRVYLVDADGNIAGSRHAPLGVHNCDGNYSQVLQKYCGDWQARWPGIPVYLCGMIGSRLVRGTLCSLPHNPRSTGSRPDAGTYRIQCISGAGSTLC